eukprot:TRINITY_DN42123_c0_g1_i3.p1 TRINITY_DN42123_c0_g1~~TRINITY_DN42123_c0_g1_i3.p1  ORF type:complete len:406 (+),score=119.44 TRINITY_DN42123_c0_g1_i3:84-1301(+)
MTEIMEMNANSMDFQDDNYNSDSKSDTLNKGDDSEDVKNDEAFEVIADAEVEEVKPKNIEHYDRALEEAICKLKGVKEISEEDLKELSDEIRRLEEKLHLWREVRLRTIERLREIADYIENISKKTGYARVVGSSGGILAGTLTIAGGVMTVMTAGLAAPVLIAGTGIGLASGLTGGAATITKKIISSKQMKEVDIALEVDAAATCELNVEVERVKEDSRLKKISNVALTVGGLASSTKGLMDLVRGASAGSTVTAGLEVVGQIFGEDVNKEITKILLQNGSRVISGAVTSVFGGVTLLWDVYQLKDGVKELAAGGEEGVNQLRNIAAQLEEALNTIGYQPDQDIEDPATAAEDIDDPIPDSSEDRATATEEELVSLKKKNDSSGQEDDCERSDKEKQVDDSNIE